MRPAGNETGRASVSPPRQTDGGFRVFSIQVMRERLRADLTSCMLPG